MADGKTFGAWLSGDRLTAAKRRVDEDYSGNASKYVVELIDRDLSGRAAATAPDDEILVALARRFAPVLLQELQEGLAHVSTERVAQRALTGATTVRQDIVLFRLLEALVGALRTDFDPESPFEIFSSRQKFEESIRQAPQIFSALQAVAETAAGYGPQAAAPKKIKLPRASAEEIQKSQKSLPPLHTKAPGVKPDAVSKPPRTGHGHPGKGT